MSSETPASARGESELERADRNLVELLGGLRVALPGVQVLFAFLLVVPFNARFEQVTAFQEKVYFATLVLTAVASALLIAPTIHHRLEFRKGDKDHLVRVSNRLAIAGLGVLALAMTGAVLFVTDFLFGTTTTVVTAAGIALFFAIFWYALPLRRLRRIGAL